MALKPILTPDTSVINRLAKAPDSDALVHGLTSGFHLRLTFTSVDEAAATSRCDERSMLLQTCKQLLNSGDCLLPVGELLEKLIRTFEGCGSTFEWSAVDVRLDEGVEAAFRSSDIGDGTSEAVRQEARNMKSRLRSMLDDAKLSFDKVLAANPRATNLTVGDLVGGLRRGGQYWTVASKLYERLADHFADDGAIHRFEASCPPFRCVMVAVCVALFDRGVRLPNAPGSLKAGWADTFMAAYLPYCQQFVTADEGQLACYREVALLCDLDVGIRSYNNLRSCLRPI